MIKIPKHFFTILYNPKKHPVNTDIGDASKGANCQLFVYSLLNYFGFDIPFRYRSDELWKDNLYTIHVQELKPFDILFFNKTQNPFAAHLGLYLSPKKIIHLSKIMQYPVVWDFEDFRQHNQYKCYLGAKRLKTV